jgi:hypothetical protein
MKKQDRNEIFRKKNRALKDLTGETNHKSAGQITREFLEEHNIKSPPTNKLIKIGRNLRLVPPSTVTTKKELNEWVEKMKIKYNII